MHKVSAPLTNGAADRAAVQHLYMQPPCTMHMRTAAVAAERSRSRTVREFLERLCPDTEILWFGSAQDVGLGSASEQGLIRKIKAKAVNTGEDRVGTDVTSPVR